MTPLVQDLWPSLCRGLILAGVLAAGVVGLAHPPGDTPGGFLPLLFAAAVVTPIVLGLWAGSERWLWAFAWRARGFLTASGGRVVLRYAPGLRGAIDPRTVLDRAEGTLAELELLCGRLRPAPLVFRRRVFVYLFAAGRDVEAVFGRWYGGTALPRHHAVVVGYDPDAWGEILAHELAHLFGLRWNLWAPPLFAEGLATWVQETVRGLPLDRLAAGLLRRRDGYFRPLLSRTRFFSDADRWPHYVLAGSFTGFLVRRSGWAAYRRFYRRLGDGRRFDAKFRRCFGLSLEEAEEKWRGQLLAKGRKG